METPIFKEQESVFDINYGWGTVFTLNRGCSESPIVVRYGGEQEKHPVAYTLEGVEYGVVRGRRTLYHVDYTPKEEKAAHGPVAEQDLAQRLKEALITYLKKRNPEELLVVSTAYRKTRGEVLQDLEKETAFGVDFMSGLLKLSIDLVQRGKETL